MAGNVSSLGIGSGVLTADIIDQLKEVDQNAVIKPLDRKIEFNKQKQDAYSLLTSHMTSLKASAAALSDDLIFAGQKADVTGDAQISLDPGTNIDSFTLKTEKLAQKDITQMGSLVDRDKAKAATGSGVLKINDKEINYTAAMTLSDLAQAITDAGGDKFSASILKTGEGAFSLIVSSKETGIANALTIEDVGGNLAAGLQAPAVIDEVTGLDTGEVAYVKAQEAQDAKFIYNGITMTRSSNTISDISVGLNITLKKEGDIANVEVGIETQNIVDEMQNFVDAYNELMSNLNDMSLSNAETGAEGVFTNDSFVKSIGRELSSMISSLNIGGQSFIGLGAESTNAAGEKQISQIFDLSREGRLSLNTANLEKKLEQDPKGMQELLSGGYDKDYNPTDGFFDKINNKLENYTGSGKLLASYQTGLETEAKNFTKNRDLSMQSLNERYATMSARFAAYDSIISRINNQFSALQMMIDSENK
jgi:flagellar hook-associated protein 2